MAEAQGPWSKIQDLSMIQYPHCQMASLNPDLIALRPITLRQIPILNHQRYTLPELRPNLPIGLCKCLGLGTAFLGPLTMDRVQLRKPLQPLGRLWPCRPPSMQLAAALACNGWLLTRRAPTRLCQASFARPIDPEPCSLGY